MENNDPNALSTRENDQDNSVKKVNIGNLQEIQEKLEESLKQYLVKEEKYRENHFYTDLKLAGNTVACLLAAFAYGHLKYYGHEKSKFATGICLSLFVIISLLLAFFSKFIEKNAIFTGYQAFEDGRRKETLEVSSVFNPLNPECQFTFTLYSDIPADRPSSSASGPLVTSKSVLKKSVAQWFEEDGSFAEHLFLQDCKHSLSKLKNKSE